MNNDNWLYVLLLICFFLSQKGVNVWGRIEEGSYRKWVSSISVTLSLMRSKLTIMNPACLEPISGLASWSDDPRWFTSTSQQSLASHSMCSLHPLQSRTLEESFPKSRTFPQNMDFQPEPGCSPRAMVHTFIKCYFDLEFPLKSR